MTTSNRTVRGEIPVGAVVRSTPEAASQVGGWSTSLENATITNLTPITGTWAVPAAPVSPNPRQRDE